MFFSLAASLKPFSLLLKLSCLSCRARTQAHMANSKEGVSFLDSVGSYHLPGYSSQRRSCIELWGLALSCCLHPIARCGNFKAQLILSITLLGLIKNWNSLTLGPFIWDEPINSLLSSTQGLFTYLIHETREDPLSHCIQSPALRH